MLLILPCLPQCFPYSDASGSVCTAVLCRPQICIIPKSAHGTNPASAIMAGMKIVAISTDAKGNIDIEELRQKAEQHADKCVRLQPQRLKCLRNLVSSLA